MSSVLLAARARLAAFSAIVCFKVRWLDLSLYPPPPPPLSSHQYSFFFLSSNHFIVQTKVLASQKCMVYLGLFHPCEQRANISDIDQDKELALVLLWQTPIFSLPSAYQSLRSAHSYLRPAAALRELPSCLCLLHFSLLDCSVNCP